MAGDEHVVPVRGADVPAGQRDVGWGAGEHLTAVEQQHPVGVLRGEVQVVQDGQHADPFRAQVAGEAQRGVLVGEVEAGGGLVEQQDPVAGRAVQLRQRPGEVHALLLAAAERLDVAAFRAARGARVLATDRQPIPPDLAAQPGVVPYPLDVTDPRAAAQAVAHAEATLGPLTDLVNVAGVLRPGLLTDLSDEDWHATFAVNTSGVFFVSRAATRVMPARRRGAVVTVGSNAAHVPRTGMGAYAASKAAAAHLTRTLGLELAGSGVRCNLVSPGSTDTPMQRQLWTAPGAEDRVISGDPETYRTGIPLGRIAQPADIVHAVLFLLSDEARHITLADLTGRRRDPGRLTLSPIPSQASGQPWPDRWRAPGQANRVRAWRGRAGQGPGRPVRWCGTRRGHGRPRGRAAAAPR